MACDTITNLLATESGRISPELYTRTIDTSPYYRIIPKNTFTNNRGVTQNVLTVERQIPDDGLTWTAVALSNGQTSACDTSFTDIGTGRTERSFSLTRQFVRGPLWCVEDIRFGWNPEEELNAILEQLATNVSYRWDDRARADLIYFSLHKVTANASLTTVDVLGDESNFSVTGNISYLSQGYLDRIYMRLMRDGGREGAWGMSDARPVFILGTSPETSEYLIKANADVRQDIRDSSQVDSLLKPLGISRSYKGWYHMQDPYQPRFNYVGGVLTRVNAFKAGSPTFGTGSEPNPAYEAAEYEVSFAIHKRTFEWQFPSPITSPGGGTRFDPAKYMGEWIWKNNQSVTGDTAECNPFGFKGRHYGVLMAATKPKTVTLGYAILHKRCGPALAPITSCYYS